MIPAVGAVQFILCLTVTGVNIPYNSMVTDGILFFTSNRLSLI